MKHIAKNWKKVVVLLLVTLLMDIPSFAQTISFGTLKAARSRQELDIQNILDSRQELLASAGRAESLAFTRMVEWTVKGLGAIAITGVAAFGAKMIVETVQIRRDIVRSMTDFDSMDPDTWKAVRERRVKDIVKLEKQLKQEALAKGENSFALAKLGDDNILFLQEMFRRNVSDLGVSVPEFYYPGQMRFAQYLKKGPQAGEKIFWVKAGKEKAFGQEVLKIWERYQTLDVNSKIATSDNILSYFNADGLRQKLSREVYDELMKGNKNLLECVDVVSAAQARANVKAAGRSFKILGKDFLVKAVPAVLFVGALIGLSSLADESDKEIMARVEQNPTLFMDVTDEDLRVLERSETLGKKYLAFCDAIHEMAQMPAQDLNNLLQQAQQTVQQQQSASKQKMLKELRLVSAR